jgi:hydrogenase nickel incorporation protein HypA/HybF
MHELTLCKNILEIIKQKALEKKCTQVKKIVLEIGELAAVDKAALIFSFNIATIGTMAQNAALQIIDIPGEAFCESCQKLGPLQQYYDACQICGSHALQITQGEELRIQSMVVE